MLTGPVTQRGNRDHPDEQHARGEAAEVQCPACQIPGRVSEGTERVTANGRTTAMVTTTTTPTRTATAGSIERTTKSEAGSPIPVVSALTIQNMAVTCGTFTAETGAKLRKHTSGGLVFTPRSMSFKN